MTFHVIYPLNGVFPTRKRGLHRVGAVFRVSVDIAAVPVRENRTLHAVAELVREQRIVGNFRRVCYTPAHFLGERRLAARPAFAVQQHGGVYCFQTLGAEVKRFYIDKRHKVKAKAVNAVFFDPMTQTVGDQLTRHKPFGGDLVPASGAVGELSVLVMPEVIARAGMSPALCRVK